MISKYPFVLLALLICNPGAAQIEIVETSVGDNGHRSVFCGLYSFMSAATALDCDVDSGAVFTGNYMSSSKGSSAGDLERLAHDAGLHGKAIHNINFAALGSIRSPVILQLWNDGSVDLESYHWVTYLGKDDEGIHVYDSALGETVIGDMEIFHSWTGNGVVISKEQTNVKFIEFMSMLFGFLWITPAVAFACLVLWVKPENKYGSVLLKSILCCSFVVAWSALIWKTDSFRATLGERLEASTCWRSIGGDCEYTRDVVNTDILIDCRTPRAYQFSHIDDAINIPPAISFRDLKRTAKDFSPYASIVIYCQNAECGWACGMSKRLECLNLQSKVLVGGYDRYALEQQ